MNNSYTWNPSPSPRIWAGFARNKSIYFDSISVIARPSRGEPRHAHSSLRGPLFRPTSRFFPHFVKIRGITNPANSTSHPPPFFLFFLFFQRTPDARPSSGYTLKPEWAGRSHFARYTKIGDAIDEIAIRVEHLRTCTWSDERVATALCKSATTRTTWPDGWERYDGTGAARNFLDNIGRSGRATGANADAYVSGGATRIHAIGACPSRTSPLPSLPPARVVHPRHFPVSLFLPLIPLRPSFLFAITRTNALG